MPPHPHRVEPASDLHDEAVAESPAGTPSSPVLWRLLPLAVYPLGQIAAFSAACLLFPTAPLIAAACFAAACLLLLFSVHIALHEVVHLRRTWGVILGSLPLSVVVGLPFDGYRMHHLNHHRHDNGPDDFSCTWRDTPDGPRPRPVLAYSLGWPLQAWRGRQAIHTALARGEAQAITRRSIEAQKILLLATVAALTWWSPYAALAYLAMTYVGWTLVSLQNYGQHPPQLGGNVPGSSYPNRLYNLIFANNGLHAEHHSNPARPWHRLRADPAAPQAKLPHLLNVG